MATVAMRAGRAPKSHRAKEIRRTALIYLGLTPFLTIAVFPIFWMLITALKQEPDLYRMDVVPFWFHLPPTLKNFEFLFQRTSFGAWIINTMLIAFWVSARFLPALSNSAVTAPRVVCTAMMLRSRASSSATSFARLSGAVV